MSLVTSARATRAYRRVTVGRETEREKERGMREKVKEREREREREREARERIASRLRILPRSSLNSGLFWMSALLMTRMPTRRDFYDT